MAEPAASQSAAAGRAGQSGATGQPGWAAAPPSGQQIELRHATQRATVVEVGGGLREYVVDGLAVLDGYAEGAMADGGRGQPLLPWPNRLADGAYTFDGQQLQLPIDETDRHNAIHGLTRWANWVPADQAPGRASLAHVLHPRPGYPFSLALRIDYALDEAGLRVRTTARNVGAGPLPFGAGQHPYLTVGTSTVDGAELHVPAAARLEVDAERRIPTGRLLPLDGTAEEFSKPRPIGATLLDVCYTDLQRDANGVSRVRLRNVDTDRSVELWLDASYRYVQVFTGDTLAPARRRPGTGGRAAELPAQRPAQRRGPDPPRAGPVVDRPVGHHRVDTTLTGL